MEWLVSIDPGVKFLGWAEFDADKQLHDCGLIKARGLNDMLRKTKDWFEDYARVAGVIEKPQVYAQRKMKGDANDLITIALVAGHVGAFFDSVDFIKPRDWKGTVDKAVMCARIENRWMNDRERELLKNKRIPKSYLNNTLDAIGIGLHHLGRHQ